LAILAKISMAFENAVSKRLHFQWLAATEMAVPAALRGPAALAGPRQAILAYP
jgi:hypothetical protein